MSIKENIGGNSRPRRIRKKCFKPIQFRINLELIERLSHFRYSFKGEGMSFLVRQILTDHLSEYESKYASERLICSDINHNSNFPEL